MGSRSLYISFNFSTNSKCYQILTQDQIALFSVISSKLKKCLTRKIFFYVVFCYKCSLFFCFILCSICHLHVTSCVCVDINNKPQLQDPSVMYVMPGVRAQMQERLEAMHCIWVYCRPSVTLDLISYICNNPTFGFEHYQVAFVLYWGIESFINKDSNC